MTSLAALFYITSCGFYVYARLANENWQRIILYVSCLLTAVFAFFSKENSATLPAAFLLIEFMFVSPDLGSRLLKSARWYHWLIILVGLILVFPIIANFVNRQIGGFYGRHFTLSERLLTELRIVVFYMSLLILPFPSRMNLDHDISLSTSMFSPPTTFFSLLFIAGLIGGAVYYRKRYPFISFGIFWYFLNLVIESSFIPLELIFEHRLYLPSVGFFLAFVSILDHLFEKFAADSHPEIKKIVFLLLVIVLSISSILTSVRNNDWRDRLSIYQDSMEKSPTKSRAVSNYAMAHGKAGNYDECVKYGMKVQSLGLQGYEDYMNSATNTLSCLILQEKYKEAVETGEEIRKQILQKDLKYIAAGAMNKYMFNLSQAYTEEKLYRKAYETFQISLFRTPNDIQTYIAINKLFLSAQEDEQGRKELKLGEDINEIPVRLAGIAFNYRQYDYAAQYLSDAVKMEADLEIVKPIKEKLANAVMQNKLKTDESTIENNSTYKNNLQFRLYMKGVDSRCAGRMAVRPGPRN
jgi:tetratricopeptide (TPR) repeat protein